MNTPQQLLDRLDAIGASLERSGNALALIGLGSVGLERDRLDAYSDLDFFAIVREGHKQRFLADLSWLSEIHPIAYAFQNTHDGYKVLYDDGIFCEFAVFERAELSEIPFSQGRVVWKAPDVDDGIAIPRQASAETPLMPLEWLVGEALTNLYVGLCRYHRGEKLAGARLIQLSAVDRILELTEQIEAARTAPRDRFARERRYEQRFPDTAPRLATMMQGYDRSQESAAAILAFLEAHFSINPVVAQRIRALCEPEAPYRPQ